MSTHAPPQSRHASPGSTVDPDADASTAEKSADESQTTDSCDTHDAAATFGACDYRLPNTIDRENKRVG
jgi:hypothetical protein